MLAREPQERLERRSLVRESQERRVECQVELRPLNFNAISHRWVLTRHFAPKGVSERILNKQQKGSLYRGTGTGSLYERYRLGLVVKTERPSGLK